MRNINKFRGFLDLLKSKRTDNNTDSINKVKKLIFDIMLANSALIRIGFKNIHGDEESCDLKNYSKADRSTNRKEDIIRIYLYNDNSKDYEFIIRLKDLVIIDKNDIKIKITKDDVDEILNKLPNI